MKRRILGKFFLSVILFYLLINLINCTVPVPDKDEKNDNKKINDVEKFLFLNGFPFTGEGNTWDIKVISFINDSYKIEKEFNNVNNMEYIDSIFTVKENIEAIGFYLFSSTSSEPNYFMSFTFDNSIKTYVNSYWIGYKSYFDSNWIRFGISKQFMNDLSFIDINILDFNYAPYYVYNIKDLLSKSLQLDVNILSGGIKYRAEKEFFKVFYGQSPIKNSFTKYFLDYDSNEMYLLFEPQDYSMINQKSEFVLSDYSAMYEYIQNRKFNFNYVEMLSDNNLYFCDYENDKIKKWNTGDDTIENIAEFTNDIKVMRASFDKNILYIAEGNNIWEYNCITSSLEKKYTSSKLILGLYNSDEYLIYSYGINELNPRSLMLLEINSYNELDTIDIDFYPSKTFVYSEDQKRFYLIDDGLFNSPNEWMYYVELDTINDKFNGYHWNFYGPGHPLIKHPDGTKIFTSYGNIYNMDYNITKVDEINYRYADLVFNSDKMYLLWNNPVEDESKLYILSLSSPFEVLGNPLTFNREGKKLFKHNDELIIITQEKYGDSLNKDRVFLDRYNLSELNTSKSMYNKTINFNRSLYNKNQSLKYLGDKQNISE